MKYAWLAIGGAAGTLLRYGVTSLALAWFSTRLPLGTFLVNVTGSFVIGLLWGWHNDIPFSPNTAAFLFIGLLGGYTTFSSFSLENLQMLRDGQIWRVLLYIMMSCGGGLLAAYAGLRLSGHFLQG